MMMSSPLRFVAALVLPAAVAFQANAPRLAPRPKPRAAVCAIDEYPIMMDHVMMDGFPISPQSLDATPLLDALNLSPIADGMPGYLMVMAAAAATTGAFSAGYAWTTAQADEGALTDLCALVDLSLIHI